MKKSTLTLFILTFFLPYSIHTHINPDLHEIKVYKVFDIRTHEFQYVYHIDTSELIDVKTMRVYHKVHFIKQKPRNKKIFGFYYGSRNNKYYVYQ